MFIVSSRLQVPFRMIYLTIIIKKVKVKSGTAVHGTPSHSYGVSLAIWDHTVLPATRHK